MQKRVTNDTELQTLINSARQGSEAACEQIYRRYVAMTYRLAYGVLLNVQDAEEVTQDAFAYVFRSIHNYDPDRSAFRTWLYTITMSRCRNKRRRKWLPTLHLADLSEKLASLAPQPEHVLEDLGVRESILTALARLSPKLREAVVLRYFDGLTYREMAEILNCPQKTAESRVRLAHNALYDLLADQRELLLEGFLRHE